MESSELALLTSETVSLPTRSNTALTIAKTYIMADDESRRKSGDFIKIVKGLQKLVKEDRREEYEAATATVTAIRDGRNRHLKPLEDAEKIMKAKEIAYDDEQTAKRLAEQQAINRELQRQAEEKAINDAIALQEMGAGELAEEVLEQAQAQPPAPLILPDTTPKNEGQHTTVYWKCRAVNLIALIKAVAAGEVDESLLSFNSVGANRAVQDIKGILTRAAPDNGKLARLSRDTGIIEEIAKLPNGTVLTPELIGHDIPGCEIYIEKSRASRSY